MFKLVWFRDKGIGQDAANDLDAFQGFDGAWPIAVVYTKTLADSDAVWDWLYTNYQVNATIHHNAAVAIA